MVRAYIEWCGQFLKQDVKAINQEKSHLLFPTLAEIAKDMSVKGQQHTQVAKT